MGATYDARSLPRLAARQHGVFTRAQALALGVTPRTADRRARTGTWELLYPAVYRLAGAPVTWRQSLLAACFAWGDGAVISHRAAGALWGLPDRKACIELTVQRDRRRAYDHEVHRPRALAR